MLCKKCGAENKDSAKFCRKCGVAMKAPADGSQSPGGAGRKKPIFVVGVCIAVAVACIVGIVIYLNGQKDAEYNEALWEAQQYVEDLDYEKAETAYLDAIDIEPKRAEAYLELSDVYVVQEEYEEALAILEKGQENTGDEETFEKRIEAVEKKAAKEPEDDTRAEQYRAYYDLVMEYQDKYGEAGTEAEGNWGYLTGCSIVKLLDFNKDGNEELIIGYLDEENQREFGDGFNHQFVVWGWHDGKLSNALPATALSMQNAGFIATAVKDDAIYMEVHTETVEEMETPHYQTYMYFQTKYMQYAEGEFVTKYDARASEFLEPAEYFINGTQVGSYEEFEVLQEDFPKRSQPDEPGTTFLEKDNGELQMYMTGNPLYLQSVLDETGRNIKLLKGLTEEKDVP